MFGASWLIVRVRAGDGHMSDCARLCSALRMSLDRHALSTQRCLVNSPTPFPAPPPRLHQPHHHRPLRHHLRHFHPPAFRVRVSPNAPPSLSGSAFSIADYPPDMRDLQNARRPTSIRIESLPRNLDRLARLDCRVTARVTGNWGKTRPPPLTCGRRGPGYPYLTCGQQLSVCNDVR